MLARNQLRAAAPSWSNHIRSVMQTCVAPQMNLSRSRSFFGTDASLLLKSQHSCRAIRHGTQRRFQVFSMWGTHHRHRAHQQGWAHTYNPCRGIFMFSRQKEEEEDRSVNTRFLILIEYLSMPMKDNSQTIRCKLCMCCRKALGFLAKAANGAIAPPAPLSEKETRAFARELHTVNVGNDQGSQYACVPLPTACKCDALIQMCCAAISANIAIFFAKLATYLASGSR